MDTIGLDLHKRETQLCQAHNLMPVGPPASTFVSLHRSSIPSAQEDHRRADLHARCGDGAAQHVRGRCRRRGDRVKRADPDARPAAAIVADASLGGRGRLTLEKWGTHVTPCREPRSCRLGSPIPTDECPIGNYEPDWC